MGPSPPERGDLSSRAKAWDEERTYKDTNVGVQSADFWKSSNEKVNSFAVDEARDADDSN